MPDRLSEILADHLVVEDVTLQALRDEILSLCSPAGGVDQAIQKLERSVKHAAAYIILDRVPWYHLFLAYAFSRKPNLPAAVQWAHLAVDGFDQLDHTWNRAITRWFCALLHRKTGQDEEASLFFAEAIQLVRREIGDLKRRSFYGTAGQCEVVLSLLLADAASPDERGESQAPFVRIGNLGVETENLDDVNHLGDFPTPPSDLSEEELYGNLLTKVLGDRKKAERLIENERIRQPGLTRKEYIIRANEARNRDNR